MPSIGISKGGLTYDPKDICDEGTPVLRSPNISNGKIVLNEVVKVKTHVRENQYLELNDILICARNGSKALVGKCAIFNLESTEKFSFGAFMMAFQTPFYDYLYYYLNSNLFRSLLNKDDTKQINQVTLSTLRKTLVPLPPFKEQLKINDLLIKVLNSVDIIRISKEDINEITSVVKKKILEDVFSNNSSYKSYYTYYLLKDVCKITMGQSPNGDDIFQNPISKSLEFHQGKLAFGTKFLNISNKYAVNYNKMAEPNSVLISVRAPVGDVNITNRLISIGRGLCAIKPMEKIKLDFLYYYMTYLKKYFQMQSTGSTFQAITVDVLKKCKMPVPPIEIQSKIVNYLNSFNLLIDSINS